MKIVSKFFYYDLLTIALKISVNITLSKMIISVLNYFSEKKENNNNKRTSQLWSNGVDLGPLFARLKVYGPYG